MADREKVASGLRHCLHYNGSCLDCPYDGPNCQNDVLDDAINLLKEQDDKDINAPIKIIRCKDCKYCEHPEAEKDWCQKGHLHGNAETWFCADGIRKEQK